MSAVSRAAAGALQPDPDAIAKELSACVAAWSSFVPSTVVEDVLLGYQHHGPLATEIHGVIM